MRLPARPPTMKMSEILLSLGRIILLLVPVYLGACVWAHFHAQRTVFRHPPATYTLGPEHLRLQTPDGVTLIARHWPNPEAKYTLLYFHGNAEELGSLAIYMDDYVRAGFAVFAYEYRGYGHSGGESSEAASYADAQLALDWLKANGTPPERVIAFGYSLGAGSAIELARTQPVAGLVVESSFVSAYRVMTTWPILLGDKFQNERKLPQVHCPVLVMHGTADPVIPHWHGELLFAAANEPKSLLIVPGGGHGGLDALIGERYWQALRDFAGTLK